MWMRAILALVSCWLVAGCVFETHELCDPGRCAEGETCIIRNGEEICRCGAAEMAGGPVCTGEQHCVSGERCNAPPVAVIGRGDKEIEVGAQARVAISGDASWDPDGDALGFTWRLVGSCLARMNQDTGPLLLFETADPAGQCELELTVNDGIEPSTASATVTIIEVGSHVGTTSPCVDIAAGDYAGKGTPANPWCSIAAGLAAATEFSLTEVRVAIGDYAVTDLAIPAGVTVRGGYTRSSTAWQRVEGATSIVALAGDPIDPRGVVLSGDGAGLVGFMVYRTLPCDQDCSIVTVEGVDATIAECLIGGHADVAETVSHRTLAPGFLVSSIDAFAGQQPATLALFDTRVLLAQQAQAAVGIALDGQSGELNAELVGVTVEDADSGAAPELISEVVGVRSRNLKRLHSQRLAVEMMQTKAAQAIGVLDGETAGFVGSTCPELTCGGSADLTLTGLLVDINGAVDIEQSVGVALFGTRGADLSAPDGSAVPSVSASAVARAIGFWSAQTRDVVLAGTAAEPAYLNAYAQQTAAVLESYAFGFVDGLRPDVNGARGGSTCLDIHDATVSAGLYAFTGTAEPETVAGVMLRGTNQASITGVNVELVTNSDVDKVVGLWTLQTRDVTIEATTVGGPDTYMSASHLAIAYADGVFDRDRSHDTTFGSTNLQLLGSSASPFLDLWDAGLPGQAAACLLWVGTERSWIGGLGPGEACHFNCSVMTAATGLPLHQIWLIATNEVEVVGNLIGPLAGNNPTGGPAEHVIGLREGDADAWSAGINLASTSLLVDANRIIGPYHTGASHMVGILLDHAAGEPAGSVELVNNAVLTYGTATSTGIMVANATATIFNNTIHGLWCPPQDLGLPPCPTPAAVGVEKTGASEYEVKLANNIILSEGSGTTKLVVDHDATVTIDKLTPSLALFSANVLAQDPQGGTSDYSLYCAGSEAAGNEICLGNVSSSPDDLLQQLATDLGPDFHSFARPVALCEDGVHLLTSGFVANANPNYAPGHDIDTDPRSHPHDIGADEAGSGTCPVLPTWP